MPGKPQAYHPGSLFVESGPQRPQALGGVGHAVKQQNAGNGFGRIQLEAAIPVFLPSAGIGEAAAMVAFDGPPVCLRNAIHHLVRQLLKLAVFQRQIPLPVGYLRVGSILCIQVGLMPQLEIRPVF